MGHRVSLIVLRRVVDTVPSSCWRKRYYRSGHAQGKVRRCAAAASAGRQRRLLTIFRALTQRRRSRTPAVQGIEEFSVLLLGVRIAVQVDEVLPRQPGWQA